MRHTSEDDSDVSGYDDATEETEEESSQSESRSSGQSGNDLHIPVPGHSHQSPAAVAPTRKPTGDFTPPRNVSAVTPSQTHSAGLRDASPLLLTPRLQETTTSAVHGGQIIENNPNDECIAVVNAESVSTPRAERPASAVKRKVIENAPHDEAIPVSGSQSLVATPMALKPVQSMRLDDERDDEDEEDAEEDAEEDQEDQEDENLDENREYRAEGYAGQKPTELAEAPTVTQVIDPQLGYNPSKYTRINATASREIQDLFKQITKYTPFSAELPAKLRPFVPDYIPAIGDLDPFVKVPRPDGMPDGLGLEMFDEPAIPQSNPAVVLLELNATNAHGVAADIVDSLENAANRPEVIDRWISDIKKVHYKKALPTVNYQRPMPDIETLMQVWPQQFEEVLNSDVAFPPPQIDLDIDQYVRTLCAILDIPTYSSLIDSLHVMFTLYEEFCSNQHFQHV
ncbi:hypothetical protein JKF63_02963 [Porcisia hertigi]|uniref:Intraflagellar transport protein 46 homolog n=1 Tax=Porcisia hertigi TaxID=2761500 RepID=A0A836HT77_9TRYP|nr:hypothetical protein JKF63_02963 [Porcisia hertigi]